MALAGIEFGLLADDAVALHDLAFAVGIHNLPVAREELHANRGLVEDADLVCEDIQRRADVASVGVRLIQHILRRDLDTDSIGLRNRTVLSNGREAHRKSVYRRQERVVQDFKSRSESRISRPIEVASPSPAPRLLPILQKIDLQGVLHMETTLIILKPDAVQRGLMGRIIARFEEKGLQVVGCKLTQISQELAATHYEAHKARSFYSGLVAFMTSSPVLVLALRGNGAITIARNMMGATFGSKANPGTIRGDFGVSNSFNLIHGSDSPEAAERELGLFFAKGEVLNWSRSGDNWVYDMVSGKPE